MYRSIPAKPLSFATVCVSCNSYKVPIVIHLIRNAASNANENFSISTYVLVPICKATDY